MESVQPGRAKHGSLNDELYASDLVSDSAVAIAFNGKTPENSAKVLAKFGYTGFEDRSVLWRKESLDGQLSQLRIAIENVVYDNKGKGGWQSVEAVMATGKDVGDYSTKDPETSFNLAYVRTVQQVCSESARYVEERVKKMLPRRTLFKKADMPWEELPQPGLNYPRYTAYIGTENEIYIDGQHIQF